MFAVMLGRKNQLSSMKCVFSLFFLVRLFLVTGKEPAPSEANEMVTQSNIGRSRCYIVGSSRTFNTP